VIELGDVEFRNGSARAVLDSRGYWWTNPYVIFPDWEGPFATYREMIDNAESVLGMCLESVQA
jgi:hypothetical protein